MSALLMSCGGGSGSSTNSSAGTEPTSGNKVSGVVMDGYLSNATVFLDLNDNGIFDTGEPSTTTNSNGAYSLGVTESQLANHSIVVAVKAGVSIDNDNPSATVSDNYSLTAPKGSTTITPLTTHIKTKIAAGKDPIIAKQELQQQLGLNNIDVSADYIAAPNLAAHKIAAAIVPVLQAVKAKREGTPTMTYAEEQDLTDTNIQSLVSTRKNVILGQNSISDASRQLSDLIMKRIPTLECATPTKNNLTTNQNGAVFSGNPSGSSTFGGTFTVPSGVTRLNQLRLNVSDQQIATNFQIKVFQGTAISGSALYTSDVIYFLNPNRNPIRSGAGGFRDTTFNTNIPVTSGQQYLIQIIGGGRVHPTSGTYDVGIAIADPANGDRIYLGGSLWGTAALQADFCYN